MYQLLYNITVNNKGGIKMEFYKQMETCKTYIVELFANNKSIGFFKVKANSEDEAREMAWGFAKVTFEAKIVNETEE